MAKHVVKHYELQWLLNQYREAKGESEIEPHALAVYAQSVGWSLPEPRDPVDVLSEHLTRLMRSETRTDKATGRQYRANHNYRMGQLTFWFDIDDLTVTRTKMQMSLKNRRDQMIDDGVLLTDDAEHWNGIHPNELPIVPVMNFTDDINERKATP